jgi:serine/threonine-protein kinase
MLLGTAQYMPPEYVEGGEYGTSGDIYSLGVLILELFAGRRRLEGKVAVDALQELLNTRFQIPAALLEEVPRMYRPLIRKATAVRVTDRFRAARDMRAALDELDRGPRLEPSLKREVRTKNFGTRVGAGRRLFTSRSSLLKLVVISGIFLGAAFGFIISR